MSGHALLLIAFVLLSFSCNAPDERLPPPHQVHSYRQEPEGQYSAKDIEAIHVAAIGALLTGDRKMCPMVFVAVENGKDPTINVMNNLPIDKGLIVPLSRCAIKQHSWPTDNITGERGCIVRIQKIRYATNENAFVDTQWYAGPLAAASNTISMQKKWGKWTIEKITTTEVS
jgi:hypothetical protein